MPRFNVSLDKKQTKIVEEDPRLKKIGRCKPKKKLKGFALAKHLQEQKDVAVSPSPQDNINNDLTVTLVATAQACPVLKERSRCKPKQPVTTRRLRSNPLHRTSRKSLPVSALDPSHVPDPSYVARGVTLKETLKKKSAMDTAMRRTLKENVRYKFLYNKLNDERNLKEQVDSTVVLPAVSFPKTTSNDIDTLIAKCKNGKAQLIPIGLLEEIGTGGKVRTHEEKAKKTIQGIRTIISYHFKSYDESKKAEKIGTWLVEGDMFGKNAGLSMSSTIARQFTRQVFSPWRLLKAIDSKCQGFLNDSAVRDYSHVERDSGLAYCKRRHSLLPKNQNQITDARNKMNDLACKIFKVQHNCHAQKSKHGDHVQVDYECLIRYLINNFGLKDKAVSGGVELVFTADGAQICGAKSASQTTAGIKIMDKSALDPITRKSMFVAEYDANNNPKVLKNYQTFQNHALAEIILHSKTKVLVNDVLRDFFIFGMKFGDVGLPANCDEPALKGKKSYANADMSFNHKCVGQGGACKVMKFFCYCCECHGDEDIFSFKENEEVCSICRHNNQTKCRHRRVNDAIEVERKTERLRTLLIQDNKRRNGCDKQLQDFIQDKDVEC